MKSYDNIIKYYELLMFYEERMIRKDININVSIVKLKLAWLWIIKLQQLWMKIRLELW